ncbi:MAG: spermidine/putrescine ABC transporter substrate-binding protein [Magnetococcales bacterium]|nr:spermidine/putrescine ABC transporter substrate-binding protein [Magnetococcales bacterium]
MIGRRDVLQHLGLGLATLSMVPRPGWSLPGKESELVLLTWPDYFAPEVLAAFEETNKVTVKQVPFESDEERDQKLLRLGGDAFDVMVVNGPNLAFYARRAWVSPVNRERMRNLGNIEPRWMEGPGAEGLGIPYFWGTLGLAYREDLLDKPLQGWEDFFQPDASLQGRIQAISSGRELVGMALKSLGHSVNTEDAAALEEAEKRLLKQRPFVASYRYIDLSANSPLVTGKISAAMVYSGDALKLQEFHPAIRYSHPREGSALWVDYLAMGTNRARRELSMTFIDFLNDPHMAILNAQSLHFATPNQGALALGKADYLSNPVIFPPEEVLKRSEPVRAISPRTLRRINELTGRLIR